MTYEELTPWDINLIKSNAIHMLAFTRVSSRYEAIAECTLRCLYAKGYNLSPYPKNLVLLIAEKLTPSYSYGSTKTTLTPDEVIKSIFDLLQELKIGINKDESREPTWHQPSDAWYHRTPNHKKPWVI